MKYNKLNKIESSEPINMTIGRLRSSIKYGTSIGRQLLLLEKISLQVERLGIKYPEDVLF